MTVLVELSKSTIADSLHSCQRCALLLGVVNIRSRNSSETNQLLILSHTSLNTFNNMLMDACVITTILPLHLQTCLPRKIPQFHLYQHSAWDTSFLMGYGRRCRGVGGEYRRFKFVLIKKIYTSR